MDFTTALSTECQDLTEGLRAVDRYLRDVHGTAGTALYREDIEGNDPDFVDGQHVPTKDGAITITAEATRWRSASVSYRVDDLGFELLMTQWSAGFLNTYVRLDVRELSRLKQEGTLVKYHLVLSGIADALGSVGGLGDIELELMPFPPEAFPMCIFRNPAKDPQPAALGLLSATRFGEEQLLHVSSGLFRIERLSGYFFLERNDYP